MLLLSNISWRRPGFDKVWHEGLIYKIKKLLPRNYAGLLESYLSRRTFVVKYKDEISEEHSIRAGVPQGSVLGPLLYLLYTADLPTNERVFTSTFADDTAILCVDKCPKNASKLLSNHLKLIEQWLSDWRIKVNEQKSSHVTFTLRSENSTQITLNNIAIPTSNSVTYLGIHLDRRLTWRRHIEAKRTSMKLKFKSLHWLLNCKSPLSLDYKVLLYKTLIKPIWTYGSQLWGNASTSNIELIQRAQSKILRTITGAPWYIRNDNIHSDTEVPTVAEEIARYKQNYTLKLRTHPNELARALTNTRDSTRLKRNDRFAV